MVSESVAEDIRNAIKPGYGVHAERQTGKTTALFEAVHGREQGRAIIVFMDHNHAQQGESMYRKLYPDDFIPKCISCQNVRSILGIMDPKVYCDEWWRFPIEAQVELKQIGIQGAVGTIHNVCAVKL